ncbi:MAG: sigma-70 family RNA polymerase sigma factor [Actinomycetota bacterium]|nr:sigma-70 family RNA polymerase sigma factor [Actinomycetota bacterium]
MARITPLPKTNKEVAQLSILDDNELVQEVIKRDQGALAEVYRRTGAILVATAAKVTKSQQLAEEVVQEVIVKLWNEPEKFDASRGSLKAFLLVQTHRRAIDLVRSEVARTKRQERVASFKENESTRFEDMVVDQVQMRSILIALANLTEAERMAIELAYFHGYTYTEVAKILREPDGTIKSRIRAGLRKIKETLEREKSRDGVQDDSH